MYIYIFTRAQQELLYTHTFNHTNWFIIWSDIIYIYTSMGKPKNHAVYMDRLHVHIYIYIHICTAFSVNRIQSIHIV